MKKISRVQHSGQRTQDTKFLSKFLLKRETRCSEEQK